MGKAKRVCGVYYEKISLRRYATSEEGVSAAEGSLPKDVFPRRIRVMSPGEESQTPSVKPIPPQVLINKQGEE